VNAKQRRQYIRKLLAKVPPEQWVVWKLENAQWTDIAAWVNQHNSTNDRYAAYEKICEVLKITRLLV
jgi:hypothetical protein